MLASGNSVTSQIATLALCVQLVNNAPSFTKGADQTVDEDLEPPGPVAEVRGLGEEGQDQSDPPAEEVEEPEDQVVDEFHGAIFLRRRFAEYVGNRRLL